MPAPIVLPPPLQPGRYLELRRQAGRLTRHQVAIILGRNSLEDRKTVLDQLVRLERGDPELYGATLAGEPLDFLGLALRLKQLFAFDPNVYLALVGAAADPAMPRPRVCPACGCTWNDPCREGAGACAWSGPEPAVCTACIDVPAIRPQAGPGLSDDSCACPSCAPALACAAIGLFAFIAVPGRALAAALAGAL